MRTYKTTHWALLCLIALLFVGALPIEAAKKEKKKKSKEIEWVMPELTGDETFDSFLKECDSLYTRMQNFEKEVPFFEVRQIKDSSTGEMYCAVVDSMGNIRNSSVAFKQYLDAGTTALTLIADFAVITTSTAAATASLPSLGLKAFSYGKYIKVGGQLALECPKKLKEMIEKFNIQKKAIRAYKENYDQSTGKLKDASIDASKIEGLNIAEAAVLDKTTEELTAGFANASKEGEDIDDSIFDNL